MKKTKSVAFSLNVKLSFKILLIGNKGCGKTSLIVRFIKNAFQQKNKFTVGVEFYSKIIQCRDGTEMTLQIWDTAGQNNKSSIARSFYHLASCVFILYDSPVNMEKIIDRWIYEVNEEAEEIVRIVLIRTKIDETPIDKSEKEQIDTIVEKYQLDFFMAVSSKENQNVAKLFTKAGELMNQLYQKNKQFRKLVDPKKDSICLTSVRSVQPKKKEPCCV